MKRDTRAAVEPGVAGGTAAGRFVAAIPEYRARPFAVAAAHPIKPLIKLIATEQMKKIILLTAIVAFTLSSLDLAAAPPAGIDGDPISLTARCPADGETVLYFKFLPGSTAILSIRGDGDTDLDFFVYDEKGGLVVSDDDESDVALLKWVPDKAQIYRVRIVNHGDVYNEFELTAG